MHQVNKQIKTTTEWKWKTRHKHSEWPLQGFAEWWPFFTVSYLAITPSLTNCLAILPPQAFLFLSCGQWRAKHTTLPVITVRERETLLGSPDSNTGFRPVVAPKGPKGSSCNSNQSLKSCNLGLSAWVMACEEDINQVAPNKRKGKERETERVEGSFWENLALSVLLSSED